MSDPAIDIARRMQAQPAPKPAESIDPAVALARQIKAAPEQQSPSWQTRLGDVVTGGMRQTRATRELPELPSVGTGDMAASAAILTAPGDMEAIRILQKAGPVRFLVTDEQGRSTWSEGEVPEGFKLGDEKGNIVLSGERGQFVLNKPGFSAMDAMQLGALTALFSPLSKAGAGLAGIGQAAAGGAAIQAGAEAAQSAAGGEFNPGDVAITGAATGAAQGIVQGLAAIAPSLRRTIRETGVTDEVRRFVRQQAVRLGFQPEDITDGVIVQVAQQTDEAIKSGEAFAVQGEREFGVPLTQGERTRDVNQLSREQRLLTGGGGDKARETMEQFAQSREAAAVQAAGNIRTGMGLEDATRSQRGAVIGSVVREKERMMRDSVSEAYDAVGDASLSADGVASLLRATRKSMQSREFDRTLPATAKLLSESRKLDRVISTFKGGQVRPFHIQQIEQMRRRFNTAIDSATDNADRRQALIMKEAFDSKLDEMVQNAMFSGDEAAMEALKQARGLFSEYARMFRGQSRRTRGGKRIADPAGDFIDKIVAANPTDEQVVNAIFGAGNGFGSQHGAALAGRLKPIAGEEGWSAIRSEAFSRLLKVNKVNNREVVSGQRSLQAFDEARQKNGTLLNELFTPEEQALMRRFFVHVQRTQTTVRRSTENPSGTAQVAAGMVRDTGSRLAQALGIASGEPLIVLSTFGSEVGQTVKNAFKTSQARGATRPFKEAIEARQGLKAVVPVAGAAASQ